MDWTYFFLGMISLAVGTVVGWLAARARTPLDAQGRVEILEKTLALTTQERERENTQWQARLADAERHLQTVQQHYLEESQRTTGQWAGRVAALEQQLSDSEQRHLEERRKDNTQWAQRLEASEQRLREQAAAHADELQRRSAEDLDNAEEEHRILEALAPVTKHLDAMAVKLADMEKAREQQYGALGEQLARAQENDEKLRALTSSLNGALRNSRIRGSWGEAQLRNIVEAAGMVERVDFDVQVTQRSEDTTGRPDMLIHLPGEKIIPLDAKVPFEAYIEAQSIAPGVSHTHDLQREHLLAQHAKALRGHVDELAKRSYWSGLPTSPDFVIAFIPSEALLGAALETDPELLNYAFSKKVALVSPVSLWSVMRSINYAWQQQLITEEAKDLFDLSRELYGRLATLGTHAENMRKAIERSVTSWNKFAGSLESRVLVTARKLNSLDEGTVLKALEPIEQMPNTLGAAEFVDVSEELGAPE